MGRKRVKETKETERESGLGTGMREDRSREDKLCSSRIELLEK